MFHRQYGLYASGVEVSGGSAARVSEKYWTAREELIAEFGRRGDEQFDSVEAERVRRKIFKKHGVGHLLPPEDLPRQDHLETRMRRLRRVERELGKYGHLVRQEVRRGFGPRHGTAARAGFDWDDLEAAGKLGLLRAVETYRPGPASLETYARRCIKNAARDFIRNFNRQGDAAARKALSLDATLSGDTTFLELRTDPSSPNPAALIEEPEALPQGLSEFERGVAQWLIAGLTPKEIAAEMRVEGRAVYDAKRRIKAKLKSPRQPLPPPAPEYQDDDEAPMREAA